jgi:hypothetical protein
MMFAIVTPSAWREIKYKAWAGSYVEEYAKQYVLAFESGNCAVDMDFPTAVQTAWYAAKVGTVAVDLTCGGGTVRARKVSRVTVPTALVASVIIHQSLVTHLGTVFR